MGERRELTPDRKYQEQPGERSQGRRDGLQRRQRWLGRAGWIPAALAGETSFPQQRAGLLTGSWPGPRKVPDAAVLCAALEAAWERRHSGRNSVAFRCGLIPSPPEEAVCLWISRGDVSSCVFPEAAFPVGTAGEQEEEEGGWCLC